MLDMAYTPCVTFSSVPGQCLLRFGLYVRESCSGGHMSAWPD